MTAPEAAQAGLVATGPVPRPMPDRRRSRLPGLGREPSLLRPPATMADAHPRAARSRRARRT
jgi:hypothetical protein